MESPLLGGLLTFLGGAAVAWLNHAIQLRAFKKNSSMTGSVYTVRQMLNVAYMAGVYFLSRVLPWELFPLLLGAALGLTVPAFFLSARMMKAIAAVPPKAGEGDPAAKGEDDNG